MHEENNKQKKLQNETHFCSGYGLNDVQVNNFSVMSGFVHCFLGINLHSRDRLRL